MPHIFVDSRYGLVNRIPGYSQALLAEAAMTQAIAKGKQRAFPLTAVKGTTGVYVRRMSTASAGDVRVAA